MSTWAVLALDRHRLRDVADLEADIDANVLVGLEQDVAPLIFAESRLLDGEVVLADRKQA